MDGADAWSTFAAITGPVSEADVLMAHRCDPTSRFEAVASDLGALDDTEGGNVFVQLWAEPGRLVVVEDNGWEGINPDLARTLSRGGRYAAFYDSPDVQAFLYAADGDIVFHHDDLVFDWNDGHADLSSVGLPHFPAAAADEQVNLFAHVCSIAMALLDHLTGVSFADLDALLHTPRPTYRRPPD